MQVHKQFDLSRVLWFRIGGNAKYFLVCTSREDVFKALDFVEKNHIKRMFFVGLGSNLIFSDKYFDGAVIQLFRDETKAPMVSFSGESASSFAGETLETLIQLSFRHELTGLEWAGGLPGTVGAGIRGNVGAFGGEIKDNLVQAEVLEFDDKNIDVLEMKNEDFHFAYRQSIVKERKNMIVTAAQ